MSKTPEEKLKICGREFCVDVPDCDCESCRFSKKDEQKDGITCPFCGDNEFGGFDREGLRFHLSSGHCEVYNETENV